MSRFPSFLLVALLSGGCAAAGSGSGDGSDGGPGSHADAGGCAHDSECSGGKACCAGVCVDPQTDLNYCGSCGAPVCTTECAAGICAPAARVSLDLFEIQGTVATGLVYPTTATVKLLAPYVSVLKGTPPAHAFDNRQGVLGCYADHFDMVGHAPPLPDANAGTVSITGYAGGTIQTTASNGHSAPLTMNCAVVGGNYQCGYGALQGGQPAASATTQPYPSDSPLGSGTITFANAANSEIGAFHVTGTAAGTLSINGGDDLNNMTFRTGQATTIHYGCSGGTAASPLILISLAATQNSASNPSNPSPTFGSVTCAALGGSSLTIPAAAITAMLGVDRQLMSVLTSAVCAEPSATPAHDSQGNPVAVVVGRGAFGISAL